MSEINTRAPISGTISISAAFNFKNNSFVSYSRWKSVVANRISSDAANCWCSSCRTNWTSSEWGWGLVLSLCHYNQNNRLNFKNSTTTLEIKRITWSWLNHSIYNSLTVFHQFSSYAIETVQWERDVGLSHMKPQRLKGTTIIYKTT